MNLAVNIVLTMVLAARGLVIPVQFEDLKFRDGTSAIDSIASGAGKYFNTENLAIGTLEFDVCPVYEEAKSYIIYGKNDSGTKDAQFFRLVQNVCRKIDKDVDFSKYGYILFAVPGESEPDSSDEELFWPQAASLSDANAEISLDGVKIDRYGVFCELGPDGMPAGIGDFAHETGHLLGLPDFYDTDAERSGGLSEGLGGDFALMDTGNKNGLGRTPPSLCAAELDIVAPSRCDEISTGEIRIGTDGRFCKLETGREGVYFLLENRNGLCVTHIDKSEDPAGYSDYQKRTLSAAERWELNEVNCRPDRPCAYIVARGARTPGICIKLDSLAVVDITSPEDGSVSFRIIEPIALKSITPLQTEAILEWKSEIDGGLISEAAVEWWMDGEKLSSEKAASGSDGCFSTFLRGLKSSTRYYAALRLKTVSGEEFRLVKSFTTRSVSMNAKAFIYLPPALRNEDGTFIKGARLPLSVYNAAEAGKIGWSFEGTEIGDDGYLELNSSGTLRAVISYEDGSTETIVKKINVR